MEVNHKKGVLITKLLKELHDAETFIASSCKWIDDEEKEGRHNHIFTTIRWLEKTQPNELIETDPHFSVEELMEMHDETKIVAHLAYMFSEPWITEEMVLRALKMRKEVIRTLKSRSGDTGQDDEPHELN